MDRQEERAVKSASIMRGTQTILTSRGFLSLASQSQLVQNEHATPVTLYDQTSDTSYADRSARNKSVATQVTPTHPASLLRSDNSRSSTPARNEIITLTTDYENRSAFIDECSSRDEPIINIENVAESEESLRRGQSPPPTISFEPHRRRWNRWSDWRLPCCTSVDVNFEYTIRANDTGERRSPPPSYSTLFPRRIRGPSFQSYSYLPVLTDGSSSFVAPTPPPSYAQAQGICVTFSLEQLVSNSASDGRMLSPRATTAVCPRCATLVITVVEVHRATATHITAFALFLMGCWPCCILPYCIDTCKTSHHYCPYCRTYLGTYNPW